MNRLNETEDKTLELRKEAVDKFMSLVNERMKAFKPSSLDNEDIERHNECALAAIDFVKNNSDELVAHLIVDIMDGLTELRRERNMMAQLVKLMNTKNDG